MSDDKPEAANLHLVADNPEPPTGPYDFRNYAPEELAQEIATR